VRIRCALVLCSLTLYDVLAFLDNFLYFLYQWKQEGILYKQVNKIYHFTLTVSPHYQVKLKARIISTILKSIIITVRSIEPVVGNFRRRSSNVRIFQFLVDSSFISLLAEKLSHSLFFK